MSSPAPVNDKAGGEPGRTPGIAKVLEESTGAISKEAAHLNQKLIAGFDQLGESLKGVPGLSGEGESKLAALGDKLVEAVIEKPADVISEALGPVVDKIASSIHPGAPAVSSGAEGAKLLPGEKDGGVSSA